MEVFVGGPRTFDKRGGLTSGGDKSSRKHSGICLGFRILFESSLERPIPSIQIQFHNLLVEYVEYALSKITIIERSSISRLVAVHVD